MKGVVLKMLMHGTPRISDLSYLAVKSGLLRQM